MNSTALNEHTHHAIDTVQSWIDEYLPLYQRTRLICLAYIHIVINLLEMMLSQAETRCYPIHGRMSNIVLYL